MDPALRAERRLARTRNHLFPVRGVTHEAVSGSSGLQYTMDESSDLLSPEQRQFYETNGYIVIKRLIEPELLEKWKAHFVKLCNGEEEVPSTMTVMRDIAVARRGGKGESVITKVQDFQDDPVLFEYCQHPRLLQYVQCFTGPSIRSVHSMLINKPPNTGPTSRHPMHQDLLYFPFRPANRICASWTAMEPITRKNGCLVVVPGTHKGELLEHGYPEWEGGVNKAYHGIKNFDPSQPMLHLEMDPGDTVFFHPILIHGSGENRTQGYRKAISCHFAGTQCHYIDTEGTVQELLAKEIELMASKRMKGIEITFSDLWRFKSRLVQGEDGTLI
eukprot:Opistho-2@17578